MKLLIMLTLIFAYTSFTKILATIGINSLPNCYHCSTDTDENCRSDKIKYQDMIKPTQCAANMNYTSCGVYQITYRGNKSTSRSDDKITYHRGCSNATDMGCIIWGSWNDNEGSVSRACACKEDGCNTGSTVAIATRSMIVAGALGSGLMLLI